MKLTINSKVFGKSITFSRPGKHYIYWDINGKPGTLGRQPTDLGGSTLGYGGDDEDEFKAICRRWYNSEIRSMRESF